MAMVGTSSNLVPLRASARTKPLHLVAREKIFYDIVERGIGRGERYCTENELAQRLKMSRNTIRRAVDGLQQEGYLSRRRRIGVIVDKQPNAPQGIESDGPAVARQRIVMILPAWDDSVEGRFSGQLIRALSSPKLQPRLAVEIRHHDDPLLLDEVRDAVVVALDPRGRHVYELQDLAARGVRVIADGTERAFEGLINLDVDRRSATRETVLKLYGMGHRHVGLFNHDPSHLGFSTPYLGYLDAHRELDKPIHPSGIVQAMYNMEPSGRPDVTKISAWVCTFQRSTEVIAGQCRQAGLEIPRDVSVVTLDDPGDQIMPGVGLKLTAYGSDFTADAAMIHSLIQNWREDLRGTMTWTPSSWIDRGSVGPPSNQGQFKTT
ncbi:MAG: LacI family DNA-binding transcriptional regulator [Phycisphaerales bacterium]|nr:LacI family DNA-binding transcriptional regulator [Phycisphaerales bacterium]